MNLIDTMVDYSRQEDMDNDLPWKPQNECACVIGCGGVGYWTAIFLAMLGTKQFVLVDGDTVTASNLNRLPVPLRWSGKYKVNVLKMTLRLLRPTTKITVIPTHITADTMLLLTNIRRTTGIHVWDCTDDARIQRVIYEWSANSNSRKYTKIGYDGWKVGAYNRMNHVWLQDDYAPGYTSSRANVLSSVMAAAMGIIFMAKHDEDERLFNLWTGERYE